MEHIKLGFAMCGSFCTFDSVLDLLELMRETYDDIYPIMSTISYSTDTRFGSAESFRNRMQFICGREIIHTIAQAEPIGPKKMLDVLVIAPCTGNTLAKLANGIADTPVTLAAKAHLRNEAPIVIAVSTNDALCGNAENIGKLMARGHYYFVPMRQDAPNGKPRSVVADFSLITDTVELALKGKQIQPILL